MAEDPGIMVGGVIGSVEVEGREGLDVEDEEVVIDAKPV
jgi:hypothetical protein